MLQSRGSRFEQGGDLASSFEAMVRLSGVRHTGEPVLASEDSDFEGCPWYSESRRVSQMVSESLRRGITAGAQDIVRIPPRNR